MANKPDNVLKFKRPERIRYLRVYTRRADKCHGNCWHCEEPIDMGDEYKGEVYTVGRKLWVRKTHYPLDCHTPEDEEAEKRERTRAVEKEKQRSALRLAA